MLLERTKQLIFQLGLSTFVLFVFNLNFSATSFANQDFPTSGDYIGSNTNDNSTVPDSNYQIGDDVPNNPNYDGTVSYTQEDPQIDDQDPSSSSEPDSSANNSKTPTDQESLKASSSKKESNWTDLFTSSKLLSLAGVLLLLLTFIILIMRFLRRNKQKLNSLSAANSNDQKVVVEPEQPVVDSDSANLILESETSDSLIVANSQSTSASQNAASLLSSQSESLTNLNSQSDSQLSYQEKSSEAKSVQAVVSDLNSTSVEPSFVVKYNDVSQNKEVIKAEKLVLESSDADTRAKRQADFVKIINQVYDKKNRPIVTKKSTPTLAVANPSQSTSQTPLKVQATVNPETKKKPVIIKHSKNNQSINRKVK